MNTPAVNPGSVQRIGAGIRRGGRAASAALVSVVLALWTSAAAGAGEHGLLWRVTKPGLPDSYVFGTIHLHDAAVARVPEPVRRALLRSRTLATELPFEVAFGAASGGLPAALATGDFPAGMRHGDDALPAGLDLEWVIGGPAFARLRHRLGSTGADDSAIRRVKPWIALLRVTRDATVGDGESLDEKLVAAARAARMRVLPLEGIDDQIASFDALPLVAQGELLRHALMHPEALDESRDRALAAWLRGDLSALADLAARSSARYPETRDAYAQLAQHLIVNRTAVMHHRLFLPLMRGGVFVAVGAAHLPGSKGLLALLREDGYRVARVG